MAANQRTSILCIAALLAATACVPDPSEGASPGGDWKSQLIALAPTTGPGRRLEWQRLQWVNNTVDGVLLDHAGPGASERLGGLANISFAYGNPQLTCRMDNSGDRLFCLGRTQEDTVRLGHHHRRRNPRGPRAHSQL